MNFFFLLSFVFSNTIQKKIEPKQIITFYEQVTPLDQHVTFSLSNTSQDSSIFYRILNPAKENSDSSYFHDSEVSQDSIMDASALPLIKSVNEKFEVAGVYTIQVYNRGDETIQFSIMSNTVKKLPKTNENIVELRSILDAIQAAVKDLESENFYARNVQNSNIAEAKRIKSTLNWLVLCPIFTFAIAGGKYVLARQLVRPKGKRFKGLF